jgi:DNA-3-methyladenine glycosylase II
MHRKALSHLRRVDPVLSGVIDQCGPCRLRPQTEGSHLEFIARSIIYQQLSTKAAATIHGRVQALCGGSITSALSGLADDALRGAGLSRQKLGYLRDLCLRAVDGTLDERRLPELPDDEIIRQLVQVKGVGVWTAQMFLMFRLVRPDVLPVLDLGVRKGVQRAYGLRKMPDAKRVEKIAARWAPYRTVASWYMWRVLELVTYKAQKASKAA